MWIETAAVLLASREFPDGIDGTAILFFLALSIGAPFLGYWLLVADIRAYLRALRGALIVVKNHLPHLPAWARQETPASLRALGLKLPCTEQDVKQAYRQRAEQLHPDRGGDRKRFMLLQRDFEQAMEFLQRESEE